MKTKALLIIVMLLILSSCAEDIKVDECLQNEYFGFWGGLWHGLISPFSFFGSLFSDHIAIYAVNNNGGWYDFGFVIGSGILAFGGGKKS